MENARVIDFTPKDGKQPMWKYVYDAVKDYDYGQELSYEKLAAMTGFSKQVIQQSKDKVNRELKKNHKKLLSNVRGFGYKMADPTEHIIEAKSHEKKGNRQTKKARNLLDNIDTSKMSLDEKMRLEAYTMHMQTKLMMVRKRNLESLDLTKKAQKDTKKSAQSQEKSIKELDSLLAQITTLKEKLS